ncbi:thiamine pyrophosphate-binding protein [Paenibacillus aestuarii]|uniref:Thiamine pyrophosphate-binding protein n=1 Tax=Paenibacillus aestuarii TaxID=516965 RepID=A0ABW0K5S8_9BACL|nr:thiamine pyrophosphate-binding protein [Paenibacillus aestuarii]
MLTIRHFTVAELIVEQLRILGVKRIYGVVGDAIFGLMDAIAKQKAISFIAVRHESVAALMASAEAKFTGGLGVCISQMGPGLANLLNGLGDAYLDQAPVLAISGQAPLGKIGTPYKQFINQQAFVQAVSAYSQLLVHPDAVIPSLQLAVHTSFLQQTVSHLSIPQNLFALATSSQPFEPTAVSPPCPDAEQLQSIVQLLRSAKQPMMLIGGGARSARESLQRLAERWGCGIALSYGALGVIPEAHPNMVSGLGEGGNPHLASMFQQADVVLAVETSWWPAGDVPQAAHVIQIVKHQADIGVSVPVDRGIAGDPANLVPHLLKGLQEHVPNQAWLDKIRQCKQKWSVQNEMEGNQSASPLHPARVVRLIEEQIDEDAVVALDEGDVTLWFLRNFRAKQQHLLLSSKWRTMGFGLPAAMAAKLCAPGKQVLCITGDGGLGMVLADLITATKYQLPFIVVVFNNGTLQMERDKMFMQGLQPEGTELMNPNFARVAEACGWQAHRVQSAEQLNEALAGARSSAKPVLLDVSIGRIPYPDLPTQH